MSNNVEERVVVLKFDNSNFEQNTKQSISTLDNLDQKLKKSGSGESLKGLSNATKSFDLGNVGKAVDNINEKFSLMGIVGTTALVNLTNSAVNTAKRLLTAIPRQIYEGGTQRAKNIEQAKFQLRGLLGEGAKADAQLNQIMEDANYAVDQTAYGLDSAAKAASQFAASGVKAGDDMKVALRGVSGLAAMTGRSYDDIAQIFAKIAGQGRIMGAELNQIASGGVNAAQSIQKYLNSHDGLRKELLAQAKQSNIAKRFKDISDGAKLTEKNIRDMVSAGVIDFQTFSTAMYDAFGEHAAKSNETYAGSLANLKAALSRIGEKTAISRLHNMTAIFNSLRLLVNNLNGALRPVQLLLIRMSTAITRLLVRGIDALTKSLQPLADKGNAIVGYIDDFLEKQPKLFEDDKKRDIESTVKSMTVFQSVLYGLGKAFSAVKTVVSTGFSALVSVGKILGTVLTPAIKLAVVGFAYLADGIKAGLGKLKEFVSGITDSGNTITSKFKKVGSTLNKTFTDLYKNLGKQNRFSRAFTALSKIASNAFSKLKDSLKDLGDRIVNLIGADRIAKWKSDFKGLGSSISDTLASGFEKFVSLLERIASKGTGAFSGNNILTSLKNGITGVGSALKNHLPSFESLTSVFGKISKSGSKLAGATIGFESFSDRFEAASVGTVKSIEYYNSGGVGTTITDRVKNIAAIISNAWSSASETVINAIKGFVNNIVGVDVFTTLKELFNKIKDLDVGEALEAALNVGKIFAVFRASKVLKSAAGVFDSLSGVFGSVSGLIQQYTKKLKMENLRSLAVSVAIIAGAMVALALIDYKRAKFSVAAISGVMIGLVAIAALISKANFDFSKIKELGIGLAGIGASFLMVSVAAKIIAKLKWKDLGKAAVALLGLVGIFTVLQLAINKVGGSDNSGILKMAEGVTLLVAAVRLLSLMKPETVLKGAAAILAAGTALAIATRLAGGKGGMSGAVGFATAISLLAPAIVTLGSLPFDKALKGVTLLSAVMLSLAVSMRVAGKTANSMSALVIMSGMLVTISGSLAALSLLDQGKLLTATGSIVAVALTLAAASKIMKKANEGVMSFAILMVILTGALLALDEIESNVLPQAAALGILAITLSESCALLSKIPITGAIQAVGSLAIFIAGFTGVLSALGALSKIDGFTELIKGGAGVFGQIGNAIGLFVGNIIGGIGEGVSAALPKIADNLSQFALRLAPFMAVMSSIKPEVGQGMKDLGATLLYLTGAEFISKFTGGDFSALKDFGDQMESFIESFKKFADEAAKIDDKSLEAATKITKVTKAYAQIAASLPPGDIMVKLGDFSLTIKSQNLSTFGEDLSSYIGNFKKVTDTVSKFDFDDAVIKKFNSIAKVSKAFTKVADGVPETGVLQKLIGTKDLGDFGGKVKTYISSLGQALKSMSGEDGFGQYITDENISKLANVAKAADAFTDVASHIPSQSKLSKVFKGDKGIDTFGTKIAGFVESIGPVIEKAKALDSAGIDKLADVGRAAEAMAKASESLSKIKGTMPDLKAFATKIKDFVEVVSEIDSSQLGSKAAELKKGLSQIASASKNLANAAKSAGQNSAKAYNSAIAKAGGGSSAATTLTKSALGGFKTSGFSDAGTKAAKAYAEAIGKYNAKAKGEALAKAAASGAKVTDSFYSAGRSCGEGFANGLSSMQDTVASKGTSLGNAAYRAAKAAIESNSPSKKFRQLGIWSGQGMIIGLEKYRDKVYKSGSELGEAAFKGADNGLSDFSDFGDPVIKPVLDLTNIQNGANSINGILMGSSSTLQAGVTARMMNAYTSGPDPIDRLSDKMDQMSNAMSDNRGPVTNIGDVTLDVSNLDDVVILDDFVEMLKRAKAFR